ncbi:MAG: DUF5666 domain-containing protein, partial [Gallionellaceae bacterium]|nr:DUF5666 domain-containing protein [Gallionellaceae bacterium]
MMDRLLMTLLLLLLVQAAPARANPCALPDDGMPFMSGMGGTGHGSGIGGTGISDGNGTGGTGGPAHSGMGGTGISDGGGVGGTGIQGGSGMAGTGAAGDGSGAGGTGVVGLITGFGSICVNGIEIHYDPNTPIALDGQPARPAQLAVGQLVSVQADGVAPSLRARRIELNSAVAGPVEWVAPDGRSFRVLGQSVRFIAGGRAPVLGESVRVNGLRAADGGIQASHVERLPHGASAGVSGLIEANSGRAVRIGGLTAIGVPDLPVGTAVRLTGRVLAEGVLAVRTTEIAPEMRLAARTDRMVLQGIVHAVDAEGVSLGYARVGAGPEAVRHIEAGQWVRVEVSRRPDGRLDAGRLLVDRPRRDPAASRRSGHESDAGAKREHTRDADHDHAEGRDRREDQDEHGD